MTKLYHLLLSITILGPWIVLSTSCNTDPGFSRTPEIEFLDLSKDSLSQGLLDDSLFVRLSFRDGDGDLGTDPNSINFALIDSRTNDTLNRFKVPPLPIGEGESGIEGTITLKVFTTCCLFPDGTNCRPYIPNIDDPTQNLTIGIIMIDDAGNQSNRVVTDQITLFCD